MSVVRFSSDDHRSDVYVYESDDGWVTHVAASRYDVDRSGWPPPVDLSDDIEGWLARNKVVSAAIRDAPLVPIGLLADGAHFVDPTATACADRLERLAAAGYHVPCGVIEAVRDEENEEGSS